jgi:hypothetical protein
VSALRVFANSSFVDYLVDVGSDEFRKAHPSSLAKVYCPRFPFGSLFQHHTNIKRSANAEAKPKCLWQG